MIWSRRRSLKEYWIHSNLIIYPQGEVTKKLMAEKEGFFIETEEVSEVTLLNEDVSNHIDAENKLNSEKKEISKSKKAARNLSLSEEEDLISVLTHTLKA
jgi:hypothetical protein